MINYSSTYNQQAWNALPSRLPAYTPRVYQPVVPVTGFQTFVSASKAVGSTPQIAKKIEPIEKRLPWKQVAAAGGMLAVGLLLHRLPAHPSSFEILSSDWKDWARMALGIGVVDQANKALGWKPEPWQLALETVTAITALSNGFTKKGWRQFPLLATFVPLLVQGTHYLNEFAQKQLEKNDSAITPWIPKVLISVTSTVLGIVTLRGVIKSDWYGKLTGQNANGSTGQVIGAETMVCSRCGGQHLVCMSEIGDMIGSIGAWFKGHHREEGKR
jgi:hypothetical protein